MGPACKSDNLLGYGGKDSQRRVTWLQERGISNVRGGTRENILSYVEA